LIGIPVAQALDQQAMGTKPGKEVTKTQRPWCLSTCQPETLRLSHFYALNNEEDAIMQNGPSQVSSGNIVPKIVGPQ
jgi:hypothetical protein